MAERYTRSRAKLFRNLADHCHDKALEAHAPHYAARWIVLMDALLWAAEPENEPEAIERLCRDPATPTQEIP